MDDETSIDIVRRVILDGERNRTPIPFTSYEDLFGQGMVESFARDYYPDLDWHKNELKKREGGRGYTKGNTALQDGTRSNSGSEGDLSDSIKYSAEETDVFLPSEEIEALNLENIRLKAENEALREQFYKTKIKKTKSEDIERVLMRITKNFELSEEDGKRIRRRLHKHICSAKDTVSQKQN